MSRYVKSPRTSDKPQIVGKCEIAENEKNYIQSLIQKIYKPLKNKEDIE